MLLLYTHKLGSPGGERACFHPNLNYFCILNTISNKHHQKIIKLINEVDLTILGRKTAENEVEKSSFHPNATDRVAFKDRGHPLIR